MAFKKKNILGFVPARGGSKGLPGKNIRPLCGKPLIAWTIGQALSSRLLTRVIVSTDDAKIARAARRFGADLPFMRPLSLATDRAPMSDAMVHALEHYKKLGEEFDFIVLLEPTSPLRKENDIDNAISLLLKNEKKADSVISLGEVHTAHPAIVKKIHKGQIVPYLSCSKIVQRRQDLPSAYFPFGVAYVVKVKEFLATRTIYQKRSLPYLIERWQNFEIDDLCDFLSIEAILKKRLKGKIE